MLTDLPSKEAAIIARLEVFDHSFSSEAAEGVLAIGFSRSDNDRMNDLAAKARKGNLTAEERDEAEAYSRVGSLLGIMKSKARQALKTHKRKSPKAKAH